MQVSGLDVVEVPVHCRVSGCPLIFHSTALPQHTLIRWGTLSNVSANTLMCSPIAWVDVHTCDITYMVVFVSPFLCLPFNHCAGLAAILLALPQYREWSASTIPALKARVWISNNMHVELRTYVEIHCTFVSIATYMHMYMYTYVLTIEKSWSQQ